MPQCWSPGPSPKSDVTHAMPMKARYTVLDGEVLAEKRAGARRELVPDPLGSTVALLHTSQAITDTFAYWPYGEERSRTGTTATPFSFVGALGYYRDSTSRRYVRARLLDASKGRWTTRDPLTTAPAALDTAPYTYASNQPLTLADRTGLRPCCRDHPVYKPCTAWRRRECKLLCDRFGGIRWCTDTYICGKWVGRGCRCRQPVWACGPQEQDSCDASCRQQYGRAWKCYDCITDVQGTPYGRCAPIS